VIGKLCPHSSVSGKHPYISTGHVLECCGVAESKLKELMLTERVRWQFIGKSKHVAVFWLDLKNCGLVSDD
jgi:hypothetical protein